VTVPDGGFQLSEHTVRQPDAAFTAKARLPEIPTVFTIAPDLAVEVVSPREDIFMKANEYLAVGTRLVWAVYPEQQMVYVLRLVEGQLVSTAVWPG
jgi:Uma2 family endonuclease